jgi:hypothetical protein
LLRVVTSLKAGSKEAKLICVITDKERRDTPEECVRQAFAHELIITYGYPMARLAIEFRIKMGSRWKQVDIAIFGANMPHEQKHIEVIIECKSGITRILPKDRNQLYSYGAACLNCKWLSIVSGGNRETFKKSSSNSKVKLVQYDNIPYAHKDQPAPSKVANGHRLGDPEPQHVSFENAKAKAARMRIEHGIRTSGTWRTFLRKNPDPELPVYPERAYKNDGWNGWPDFFGVGFRPFEEARIFVRKLKLPNDPAWRDYSASGDRPDDIPSNPHIAYKDKGYVDSSDWLGTQNIAPSKRKYRDFDDAHQFVMNLRLRGYEDWRAYCDGKMRGRTIPGDIPKSPHQARVYEARWRDWTHWLTGTSTEFLTFEAARDFVRKRNLCDVKAWNVWLSENGAQHPEIPRAPASVYRGKGWSTWPDWLGTKTIASKNKKFLPFDEAHDFARRLGLDGEAAWRAFSKGSRKGDLGERPSNIPANPDKYYESTGWTSWPDWLGHTPRRKN